MPQQRQRCRDIDLHEAHAWQPSGHGTNYRWCVGKKQPAVKQQCPNTQAHSSHRWRTNPPGDVWCMGAVDFNDIAGVFTNEGVIDFGELYGVGTVTDRMKEIVRGEVEAMTMNPIGNQSKLDALRAERERVLAELQRLERFPEQDPYEGTVVIYAKIQRAGQRERDYAFLRLANNHWAQAGLWYSTGGRDAIQRASWTQLVEWLAQYDILEWEVLKPAVDQEPTEDASDAALAEADISELS